MVATPNHFTYTDAIVKMEGVSVKRGDTQILRDVNLEIRDVHRPGVTQGQVVGLLGPTGMGKTTMFRILAGLDTPDTGRVLLEKEGKPVQRGMVGVVAQHYPLFDHRTVLGNLIVAGRQTGKPKAEVLENARDILKRFGIEDQASKYPCQLSGGQRQRAAIAQQFMCSEHLLLMDEPFSGLDIVTEDRVLAFLREIAQSDELKTFIIVTHDITAALQVADTIWLLGRDRDSNGKPIPGARIQATFDLAERGLAWQENITGTPEFLALRQEIREAFADL